MPPGGFGIDSMIDAAALRAPAASRENSCPQTILKFQPHNSFDYRVRYEPQLISIVAYVVRFSAALSYLIKFRMEF